MKCKFIIFLYFVIFALSSARFLERKNSRGLKNGAGTFLCMIENSDISKQYKFNFSNSPIPFI